MALVRSPIFDQISKSTKRLTFRTRKNKKIDLSVKRIPRNPRTEKQISQRKKYTKCVEQFKKLSENEKAEYAKKGLKLALPAYHVFMMECLKAIPFHYKITIDNTANPNSLSDYQVLLEIINDTQFFLDCENNQIYLEFYDSDQTTLLNHYTEEWDTVNKNAKIWLKIPQIPASATKTIYLKINTTRTEDLSNGEAVFDFFDDFTGTELDTTKWEYGGTAGTWAINVADSVLELYGNLGAVWIRSLQSFNYPIAVRAKVMDLSTFDDKNKTRNRYISSNTNQNPFGSDCGVFDHSDNPTIQLFWKGAFPGIPANLDVFQISEEIFIPNQKFRWRRPEWDKENTTTLTSIKLQYGVGEYGHATAYGHMKFDFIAVRKYTEPEPTVSYEKL